MSKMAYIVGGDTGEYSDHRAWYVRAFLDKSEADAFCEKLNAWCREHGFAEGSPGYERCDEKPPDDPQFQNDYTGTRYSVCEVPLGMAGEYNVAK